MALPGIRRPAHSSSGDLFPRGKSLAAQADYGLGILTRQILEKGFFILLIMNGTASLDNAVQQYKIKKNDLIICATDNRESRLLINKLCIAENKVCIYGGTFRRACGGQVLRVIPHKTLCYDCFLSLLPDELTNDYEISNQRQASRISYSDRVVPVEPGLSSDILPISTFITKLAILELLKDKEHSMKSLYDDFTCPLYLWINRREYQFSNLLPMEAEVDRMSIMRWYGVKVNRYEKCFTCGEMPDLSESEYMIFQ